MSLYEIIFTFKLEILGRGHNISEGWEISALTTLRRWVEQR